MVKSLLRLGANELNYNYGPLAVTNVNRRKSPLGTIASVLFCLWGRGFSF
ncbi:hypothetical protein LXJ15735_26210 [Lacrimispora xylanolytica]